MAGTWTLQFIGDYDNVPDEDRPKLDDLLWQLTNLDADDARGLIKLSFECDAIAETVFKQTEAQRDAIHAHGMGVQWP